MAHCGLCRRKCRSQRFHSSWQASALKLLTPKSHPLVRAVASCRMPTGGKKLYLSFWFVCAILISLSVFAPCCIQGLAWFQKVSPVSFNRYYEYVFGAAKRQGLGKSRRAGAPSELTELQVWITSPDAECDGYPSVTSDESCESLVFLIDIWCDHYYSKACAEVKVACCYLHQINYVHLLLVQVVWGWDLQVPSFSADFREMFSVICQ